MLVVIWDGYYKMGMLTSWSQKETSMKKLPEILTIEIHKKTYIRAMNKNIDI